MQITGITALVTGAASGLGAATAALLAEKGAQVVGFDLPGAVENPVSAPPTGVRLIGGDVTSEEGVLAALATIGAGDPPLRLVVNCAGIAPARRILSSKGAHDLATFQKTIAVNLVGTFNVMRLAAEAISQTEPVDEF